MTDNGQQAAIFFGDDATAGIGRIVYDHNENSMAIYTSSDENFLIDSSGNVGIRTTSPATALDVKGKVNITGNFTVGEADNILFVDNTSKEVGIGTSDPSAYLEIEDTSGIADLRIDAGTDPRLIFALDGTDTWTIAPDDSDEDSLMFAQGGAPQTNTRMAITKGGNVGIGNTNPNNTLDVSGDANITGTLYSTTALDITGLDGANVATFQRLGTSGNIAAFTDDGQTVLFIDSRAADNAEINAQNGDLRLQTSGSDALTIDTSQQVGIGQTAPFSLLQIGDGADTKDNYLVISTSGGYERGINFTRSADEDPDASIIVDSNEDLIITYGQDDLGDSMFIKTSGSGTTVMTFDSAGEVGIGTTTPTTEFYVQELSGNSDSITVFNDTDSNRAIQINNNAQIEIIDETGQGVGLRIREDADTTDRFQLAGNGLMGWTSGDGGGRTIEMNITSDPDHGDVFNINASQMNFPNANITIGARQQNGGAEMNIVGTLIVNNSGVAVYVDGNLMVRDNGGNSYLALVNGGGDGDNQVLFQGSDEASDFLMGQKDDGGPFLLYRPSQGLDDFSMDYDTGFIGINTDSPIQPLHVAGDSSKGILVTHTQFPAIELNATNDMTDASKIVANINQDDLLIYGGKESDGTHWGINFYSGGDSGSSKRMGIDGPTGEVTIDAQVNITTSDTNITPSSTKDDLIVQGSTPGISVLSSSDSNPPGLAFGTPSDEAGAYMDWNHDERRFRIGPHVDGGETWFLRGAGSAIGAILYENGDFNITASSGGTLHGGRNIFSAYDATGGLQVPTVASGPVPIPFDTELREGSYFTHATSGDNSNVTVSHTGWYTAYFDVCIDHNDANNNRVVPRCYLELGDGSTNAEVTGSGAYGYSRWDPDGETCMSAIMDVYMEENEELQVSCSEVGDGYEDIFTIADASRFRIEYTG